MLGNFRSLSVYSLKKNLRFNDWMGERKLHTLRWCKLHTQVYCTHSTLVFQRDLLINKIFKFSFEKLLVTNLKVAIIAYLMEIKNFLKTEII